MSRKDIYRALAIRPTDMWLPLRELIIARESNWAIKRSHCSGNEEDKLEQRERNTTYQRRNILIYLCVFMIPIPIPIISISRIY